MSCVVILSVNVCVFHVFVCMCPFNILCVFVYACDYVVYVYTYKYLPVHKHLCLGDAHVCIVSLLRIYLRIVSRSPTGLPLSTDIPVAFTSLPEHIVEDIAEYLVFTAQLTPEFLEGYVGDEFQLCLKGRYTVESHCTMSLSAFSVTRVFLDSDIHGYQHADITDACLLSNY